MILRFKLTDKHTGMPGLKWLPISQTVGKIDFAENIEAIRYKISSYIVFT